MPFQVEGVTKLLENRRFLLSDSMGCGKTVQALAAIEKIPQAVVNVLIICPASLVLDWKKAAESWLGSDVHCVLLKDHKSAVEFAKTTKYRLVIVSYHFLLPASKLKRILSFKWDVIVLDEADAIKNPKSITSKATKKIFEKCEGYIWFLSGTPASNSAADYYVYLSTIQPDKWGSYKDFQVYFCNEDIGFGGHRNYWGWREDRKKILKRAFSKIMLRRRLEDVIAELPAKMIHNLPVVIDEKIVSECLKIDRKVVRECLEHERPLPGHVMSVMRSIGMAKVATAVEWLESMDHSCVVFCSHIDVLDRIGDGLTKDYVRVTGSESSTAKKVNQEKFRLGLVPIILCNLKAAAKGLNLQTSAHMLLVEQYWSPTLMEQAMARVIRIGQSAKCVHITNLLAYGTIDDDIVEVCRYKSKFLKEILGD